MVYEGVCDDFAAARFSKESKSNKPSGSEWMGVLRVGSSLLPDLNLFGGVSRLGMAISAFASVVFDSLLSVQLSTDFEEQVLYGGQNAEQRSRGHRIARRVK